MAAAAVGAIGFGPAGGDCGNGAAALAAPPGGGDGEAVTGWNGGVSNDGFADFPVGCVACFPLSSPGDCVPGVIAAEGTEAFALGGCDEGVAGVTLFAGPGDGATDPTAAEGIDGECFATGVCEGGGVRLSRPAEDGCSAPGVIVAEGLAAFGGCGARDLAPPPAADDGVPGTVAIEGDVDVADDAGAGACEGVGPGLVLRGARDGVVGAIAAEGLPAVGVCGARALASPPGVDDGGLGVVAAEGDLGAADVDAGACEGAGPGFVLPGAADGIFGAIAADGVLSVVGLPGGDGRGCPFIPGKGWPN